MKAPRRLGPGLALPEVREAVAGFLKGKPVTLTRAALPPLAFVRPATARK